jgi:hypothetical protein
MKTIAFVAAIAAWVCAVAFAADDYPTLEQTKQEGPDGTVVYNVGANSIVVPKDARVTVKGAQIIVEDPSHYVARIISNFEKRIDELQHKIENLENRVNSTTAGNHTAP